MKPLCFWSHATHRSKTLSSSRQRRQAATAQDLSACSAPIHARPLMINLFCEASLLVSSTFHRSKTLSSSRHRRQAAKAKDLSAASAPIHARPLRLNLFCETSLLFVSRHSPLKDTQFKPPKKTSSNSEGPFCRLSPYSCKTSDDQSVL